MKQAACLCVLLAMLGGCKGSTKLKHPTAQVAGVKVLEKTDEGTRVGVTVTLSNPNNTPLPLIKSQYKVSVTGGQTFTFTETLKRTLPANGVQTVELPAVFKGDTAASYQVQGSVTYKPPGEIRKLLTDSGIPLPKAGFSGKGELQ